MNKKLTTIILAVLLILIGKVDAATLTQKVGGSYISATLEAGQHVKLNFINQANYTFTNWTVESGNVTIDTTNPNVTFIMPNSDVVIRGNYLEETATPQNYSITYNANGGTGSMAAQTVTAGETVNLTTNTFTRSGYTFKGWSTDATATSATYTDGQNITPTASMTLYAIWEQQLTVLSDVATVGAYVTYVPSSTSYTVPTTVSGYTSDQTYTPSSTTSWRVFSNDGTNVEIISTDSVGDLYLNDVAGYINVVQTLNDISSAYVNTDLASSARHLGYYDEYIVNSDGSFDSVMATTQQSNYKTIDTSSYPLGYTKSGFPYIDYQYMPDLTVLSGLGMYDDNVWLATHYVLNSNVTYFDGLETLSTGVGRVLMCQASSYGISANSTPHSNGNGVRPVVSLKSGLTITGGSGTSADPYIINTTNPSQYTVTYSANGGYGDMVPQSVVQGSSIILNTNAYEHHSKTFAGWATDATSTTAAYTDGQNITPTADMTLYAIWEEPATLLSDVATVGAYVTYVPSSTSYTVPTTVSGYTSDQTYNPSNTTSWRVLSNDGINVEIVSTDSVGDLYLTGTIGYVNVVQTLQDMSKAYVNNTYATSGRSLGYYDEKVVAYGGALGADMTETQQTNYKKINTSSYSLNYNVSGFPYTDYQLYPDKTALANHGSMYHSSEVWLASRYMGTNATYSYFGLVKMDVSGNYSCYCSFTSDGSVNTIGAGMRSVVSLKSGLAITGGTGTSTDPYIINTTNSSQYTVTYSANGGYGEMNPQSVSQGRSITLTTNTYEHHNFIFLGWSTSATATTATYTDGQTITPTADMTLYAIWESAECDHNYTTSSTKEDCVKTTTYTCSICSDSYTDTETYHTYNNNSWYYGDDSDSGCWKDCDCGEETTTASHYASYYNGEVISEATCETDGEIEYYCGDCGAGYTETISAPGHDYQNVDQVDATCEAEGYIEWECSRCGDSYIEDIPATGHTYPEYADWNGGSGHTWTCETCGESYTEECDNSNGSCPGCNV